MQMDWETRITLLAQEHGPMVFATAYRVLGNSDDAEDVLQDVFLGVLNSWWLRLKADRVSNWGGYLRVAAVRGAVALMKRRRQNSTWVVPLDEQLVEHGGPDPRQQAITRQGTEMLRQALCRLPDREARVFVLRFFEDCSYQEIAEQTGLGITRVGVLIHRARGRLRMMLEPCPDHVREGSGSTADTGLRGKETSHVAR